MPALNNPRHERFAQELAKGKTASEAYEQAGYKPSLKNSQRLKCYEDIRARVAEIQERGAIRAGVTVESLLAELESARRLAEQLQQPAAMISASMGKGKVAGLIVDKQERKNITDYDRMSDAELEAIASGRETLQ